MTGDTNSLQFFSALPPEISRRILSDYVSGQKLAALAQCFMGCKDERYKCLLLEALDACEKRIETMANFIESKSAQSNNGEVEDSISKAVAWIRSVVTKKATTPTKCTHQFSSVRDNYRKMALLHFLEDSLANYSRPDQGEFEWPVWVGQICVESSSGGTRLRSTARVILTAPLSRPSFVPGAGLMKNQTPSTVFREELYNMVPRPPWACLRPFPSDTDEGVLQKLAERRISNRLGNNMLVPAGFYHSTDILDVRILSAAQAEVIYGNQSWRPRNDWIIRSQGLTTDAMQASLICCWQDDSDEITDDSEYLQYIVDMLKAKQRLAKSNLVSSRVC